MTGLLVAPVIEARPLIGRWMVAVMLVERLFLVLCGGWILAGPEAHPSLMVAGLLGLWFLYTLTNGWASTAWGAYVARALSRTQRGQLHGMGSALVALSGLAVVPLVGLAITHFGLARGYGGAFLAAGLLLMSSCLIFLRAREEPYPHVKRPVTLSDYLHRMMPLLRADGRFRWFLTVMTLWLMGTTGASYFTVYAMERFQADASMVMGYTVAMSLGAGVAGLASGRVASRVGFVHIYLFGILGVAASMTTAFLAPTSIWFYGAFALAGAGGAASWMAVINLPMELAEAPDVPTYYAVASVVRGPAGVLAPVAAGLYLGHFPHQPLYLFCALTSLVAAVLLVRFVREPGVAAVPAAAS